MEVSVHGISLDTAMDTGLKPSRRSYRFPRRRRLRYSHRQRRKRWHQVQSFSGKNTGTGSTVYSFIVADGSLKNSYSGDLLPFFTYLEKFESGLSGMLLQSIQAGTEVVTGSATFSTSSYTISSS